MKFGSFVISIILFMCAMLLGLFITFEIPVLGLVLFMVMWGFLAAYIAWRATRGIDYVTSPPDKED